MVENFGIKMALGQQILELDLWFFLQMEIKSKF